jgi:hypothetical protein
MTREARCFIKHASDGSSLSDSSLTKFKLTITAEKLLSTREMDWWGRRADARMCKLPSVRRAGIAAVCASWKMLGKRIVRQPQSNKKASINSCYTFWMTQIIQLFRECLVGYKRKGCTARHGSDETASKGVILVVLTPDNR